MLLQLKSFIARHLSHFWHLRTGNVALLAALLIVPMMAMIGLAVDYGMASMMRARYDKAAQVSALAGANHARNYLQSFNVTNASQDVQASAYGQNIAYFALLAQMDNFKQFTLTQGDVLVTRVGNTISSETIYDGYMPTNFGRLFGIKQIRVNGRATIIIGMVDNPSNTRVLDEIWSDTPIPDGRFVVLPTDKYRDWAISSPDFEGTVAGGRLNYGTLSASGDARAGATALRIGKGYNDVVSKKVFLPAGAYEFRYWIKSAVEYPQYKPTYICHIMREAMDWANDGRWRERGSTTLNKDDPFTTRIGVYLEPIAGNPRLATTAPNSLVAFGPNGQQVNNRIDDCIYAHNWVQRSIKFTVTDTGYFWLSFATEYPANGKTKNGALLGRVTMCINICAEPQVDNNPWYTIKNGGVHTLMADGFETPAIPPLTQQVMDFIPMDAPIDPLTPSSGTYSSTYEPNSATQTWHPKRWNVNPGTFRYVNTKGATNGDSSTFGNQHAALTSAGKDNAWRRVLITPGIYLFNVSMREVGSSFGCLMVNTSYESRDMVSGDYSVMGDASNSYRRYYDNGIWCDYPVWDWTRASYCIMVAATRFYDFGVMNMWPPGPDDSLRLDDVQVQAYKGPTEISYANAYKSRFTGCAVSRYFTTAGIDWGPGAQAFYLNRVIVYYVSMQ